MGSRFAGMSFEQAMSMAQTMVSSAGLDSSDYGLVSRVAGEIQRAGDTYTREQEKKQRERERAILKHAQEQDRSTSSRRATTRTPAVSMPTSSAPSRSGYVGGGGGGTTVNVNVSGVIAVSYTHLTLPTKRIV